MAKMEKQINEKFLDVLENISEETFDFIKQKFSQKLNVDFLKHEIDMIDFMVAVDYFISILNANLIFNFMWRGINDINNKEFKIEEVMEYILNGIKESTIRQILYMQKKRMGNG